jgi:hypothetical protein
VSFVKIDEIRDNALHLEILLRGPLPDSRVERAHRASIFQGRAGEILLWKSLRRGWTPQPGAWQCAAMAIRVPLLLHPDSVCGVQAIEVEVARVAPRRIELRYFALGGAGHIKASRPRGAAARTDDLWKTTCFEAFVQAEGDTAYYEFNFATSGNWAAYRFDGRREGRTDARVGEPQVEWSCDLPFVPGAQPGPQERAAFRAENGWLGGRLVLDAASDLPLDRPWHLGLTAVIEEKSGRKSWWALAHPPGEPDFHDPACFTLELPAAR